MNHGEVRHHGIRTESNGEAMTIAETWCAHCAAWVPTNGVLGPLRYMARHRDGDCRNGAARDLWRPGGTVSVDFHGTLVPVTITVGPTVSTDWIDEERWQAMLDMEDGDPPFPVWVVGPSARCPGRIVGEVHPQSTTGVGSSPYARRRSKRYELSGTN